MQKSGTLGWVQFQSKKWLNEVAYIGDDFADIPILENVGFSACPSDAINDVINICNYICSKKENCLF